MREEHHIVVGLAQARQHRRDAGGDSLGVLPLRYAVAPQRPARPLPPYLLGGQPFVSAIVPLDKLAAGLSVVESSQPARIHVGAGW